MERRGMRVFQARWLPQPIPGFTCAARAVQPFNERGHDAFAGNSVLVRQPLGPHLSKCAWSSRRSSMALTATAVCAAAFSRICKITRPAPAPSPITIVCIGCNRVTPRSFCSTSDTESPSSRAEIRSLPSPPNQPASGSPSEFDRKLEPITPAG